MPRGRPKKNIEIVNHTIPKLKFDYSIWAKDMPGDNDSSLVWARWLEREKSRWANGYEGLDGYHYFSLTQAKFKNARGEVIRPHWRDTDELIFSAHREAINRFQDIMYVKRRESGLTTIFGGVVPICNALLYEGGDNLLTSADKMRMENMFMQKAAVIYNNLHEKIKPSRVYARASGLMHFGVKDTKTNEVYGLDSTIICKDTVEKPTGLEGYRTRSIFLDEYFLHPKANKVRVSAQACLRQGMIKIGPMVLGGSCNETSKEGIAAAKELWADSKYLGVITCFIPGWIGLEMAPEYGSDDLPTGKVLNFSQNGVSDEKAATEWILKRRERLDKAQDKTELLSFIKEYPLSIDEVFDVNKEGILGPEVMARLSEQAIKVRNEPPPIGKFDLHREGGVIKATPTPRGCFTILEHPQPGQLYISGTDPIPFNSTNLSEGSEYSNVIKKKLAQSYVAYYSERNLDVDSVCRKSILLQEYYNGAKTMMENNVFGAIKQAYKNVGKLDLLARQPSALGIKFTSANENYGYYKNTQTSERGLQLLVKYLLGNMQNVYFPDMLKQIEDFGVKNCDIIDAMIACEFYDEDMLIKSERKINKIEYREVRIFTQGADGKTGWKWVKMPIK